MKPIVVTGVKLKTLQCCTVESVPLFQNTELPSFVNMHSMKDQYLQLVEGDTTQLSCQASGKPKPEIRWFKDGDELSSDYNSVGSNWLLTLSDMAVSDGGRYMCNVFNRVGSLNYTYIVKVTGMYFLICTSLMTTFWLCIVCTQF